LVVIGLLCTDVWYVRSHPASGVARTPQIPFTEPSRVPASTIVTAISPSAPTAASSTTSYPGQEPSDVVANNAGVADVSGVTVRLTNPTTGPDNQGREMLCASVSLLNGTAARLSYDYFDWSVQYPNGDVQRPDPMGTDEDLGSGQLIPGGDVSGKLCFDDTDQVGVYVLSFEPEAILTTASPRGVWLVKQGSLGVHQVRSTRTAPS
jgi:hypothetical protein